MLAAIAFWFSVAFNIWIGKHILISRMRVEFDIDQYKKKLNFKMVGHSIWYFVRDISFKPTLYGLVNANSTKRANDWWSTRIHLGFFFCFLLKCKRVCCYMTLVRFLVCSFNCDSGTNCKVVGNQYTHTHANHPGNQLQSVPVFMFYTNNTFNETKRSTFFSLLLTHGFWRWHKRTQ